MYSYCVLQEGNDFGEVFDEMTYLQRQVLLVKLQVDEPHIDFSPSFQELWEFINRAFMEIIKSAEELPRVQRPPGNTSLDDVINIYFVLLNTQCCFCLYNL